MPCRVVAALVICLIVNCCTVADDLRSWSDVTGKYKIEAKFIAIEGTKVVLEKADGSRIQIELDKLALQDRVDALKMNLQAKNDDNPFKEKDNNPFKDSARKNTTRPGDPMNRSERTSTTKLSSVDWAGTKLLSVFGSDWKPANLGKADLALNWQPRAVSMPSRDFFEKITGVVASPVSKHAVVLTSLEKPGTTTGGTGMAHFCNLEKGVTVNSFPLPSKQTPLALSTDGTQLLTREDIWGHNHSHVVTLWKISPTELTAVQCWDAAKDEPNNIHGKSDVGGGQFLNDTTVLIWQTSGMLTWWNTTDLKPTQMIQLKSDSSPTLSSNLQVIVAKANNDLVLLDANSGDTLSVKTMNNMHFSRMAFSPDGSRLACITHNKAEIYEVATGNLLSEISVSGFNSEAPCFWTSNTALLAGSPLCFISTELNINVWSYEGIEKLTMLGDTALVGLKSQGFTLVPVKFPHAGALQMIEQAKKDPRFFVLKPGSTVKIDASGISDQSLQKEVVDGLTNCLERSGHSVGSGNVTLVASMEKGKDHEVSYRTFGMPTFGRSPKTYNVPGWNYQLKIVADGKTHWLMNAGNHPPPIIHLKEDETIESHLKQYGAANVSFFKVVELPKYVARAQSDQTTGSLSLKRSTVTPNGIR